MVATLAGSGALLFGLALLLLPLLATELSRPGDSAWGALVLVLALVLVTSADRLDGAPMLAVICGGLLIGRLTVEVGRGRWRQLSPEEQGRLGTRERWSSSFRQASLAVQGLMASAGRQSASLLARWQELRRANTSGTTKAGGKRWVRPEAAPADPSELADSSVPAEPSASADAAQPPGDSVTAEPSTPADPSTQVASSVPADPSEPAVIEVSDFLEIDALLQAAPPETSPVDQASRETGISEVAPPSPAAADRPFAVDAPCSAAGDGALEDGAAGDERSAEGGGAG